MPLRGQVAGDAQRPVSADDDQGIEVPALELFDDFIGDVDDSFFWPFSETLSLKGLPRLLVPRMVPPV